MNKKFSYNNVWFEKDGDLIKCTKNIDRGVVAITKNNIYTSVLSDPNLYHVQVTNTIVEMLLGHKFNSLDIYESALYAAKIGKMIIILLSDENCFLFLPNLMSQHQKDQLSIFLMNDKKHQFSVFYNDAVYEENDDYSSFDSTAVFSLLNDVLFKKETKKHI